MMTFTVKAEADKFIDDHEAALTDLLDKIVGEAMAKLPCLALGSQQQMRGKLMTLIARAVAAKFDGGQGCTGAWESDDTFVVTIDQDPASGGQWIRVALSLGETWIDR